MFNEYVSIFYILDYYQLHIKIKHFVVDKLFKLGGVNTQVQLL